MTLDEILWIWVGALIANITVSFIFKRTYAFKIAERITVGAASGYSLLIQLRSINNSGIQPIMDGHYSLIIAFILGALFWARLIPKYRWVSRYPTSVMIGIGLGVMLATSVAGQIIGLSVATINDTLQATGPFETFNAVILLIGTLSSLSFFIYTKEQTGAWGAFTKLGILFMYVLFGLAFAGQYLASGMERTIIAFGFMFQAPLRTLGIVI